MKALIILATASLLAGCDTRVNTAPPVVEKNTTIVNPPDKKVENNTTIVNPPATTEKKETTTTITK